MFGIPQEPAEASTSQFLVRLDDTLYTKHYVSHLSGSCYVAAE